MTLPESLRSRGNYRRGAVFERKVAAALAGDGYWVARAAGSHGKADLIAIKIGQVVLVNCKLPGPGGVPPAEWNDLWELSRAIGVIAVVAHRPARGRIEYLRLVGPKLARTRKPPAAPWTPDEIGKPVPPLRCYWVAGTEECLGGIPE